MKQPTATPAPSFAGKTALITGAGRGIGAATARLLARQGARVVLVSRTLEELDHVLGEIDAELGAGRALAIRADLAEATEIKRVFERAKQHFGPVQVLINNAARVEVRPFTEIPLAEWDQVQALNVRAPFLCSQLAFAQMIEAGHGGAIVQLSSLGGLRSTEKFPGLSSYVVSKFAMVGLTESLAVEGRPHRIRVNCVAPGAVDTVMLRKAAPHLKTQTQPEDVARTIAFLCDDYQSGALNGACLEIFSNL